MDSTSHDLYPPLTDDEIQQAFFPSSLALPPAFPPFAPSLQPYTQRHADALLMAPFFPPVSMAPQSHVRSQQTAGADAGAVDTMPRRAPKRRRLDISSESSTTTEINQFRSAQLPLNGSLLAGLMPTDASVSLCCSSCPDGEPCDSPECDDQCEQVVACLEPDCEAPLCTDTCLSQVEPASKTALRDHDRKIPVYIGRHDDEHKVLDEYGNNTVLHDKSLHQSVWQDPLHSLDDGTKDAYTEQDLALLPMNRVSLDSSPFYSSEYSNATVSGTELSSLMDTSTMLHDAVDLFSGVQPTDYPRQCEWDACRAMMNSAQDCFRHIHDFHFDPQITWNCPTGLPACEGFIAGNPLNHLVSEHGWLVASNEEQAQYKCPAPMCQDESIFLDTQQLHHHFDEQHATPTTGELQCQWQTCSTVVENPQDLIAHLVHQHRLPMPTSPKKEEATRNLLPDVKAVAEDNHLACRWCDAEDGHVCGKVCSSETDLHEHVKEHIARLVRNPGFECQWEGCRRNVKPGEKKGFSQRGKLERHMASHTGYKCCTCDWIAPDGSVCGKSFSAPQALNQHRLLHTGEKPWACRYCGKDFPQQSARTIHERTHTKEKPLKCEICGMAFSESSNLAKHRKIHGEKGRHACREVGCNKTFHRLDQLKLHAKTHCAAGSSASTSVSREQSVCD